MSRDDVISIEVEFENNRILSSVFGEANENLVRLEDFFSVVIHARGNRLTVSGKIDDVKLTKTVLNKFYAHVNRGLPLDFEEQNAIMKMVSGAPQNEDEAASGSSSHAITTRKKVIAPRTLNQERYLAAIKENDLTIGLGPAGTGKTYLAVAVAVSMLITGRVERIILSRPAVEAGERLGFLPGDLKEKIDPYLRPLYDALHDMLPSEQILKRIAVGEIEIAPLAFMRGRTLSNAFIILDEAQNTTPMQMKMFLTRLGHRSKMVITGDLSQIDLPVSVKSGLKEAVEVLSSVQGVNVTRFESIDVVRHDLVSRIVDAYDAYQKTQFERTSESA